MLAHVDNDEVGIGGKSEVSMGRLEEMSIGRFQWHRANFSYVGGNVFNAPVPRPAAASDAAH